MDYFTFENNIIQTTCDMDYTNCYQGCGDHIFQSMKMFANNLAQIEANTGKKETYGSLLKRIVRTAIKMKEIGIKENDLVCVYSENTLDSTVPFLATQFVGGISFGLCVKQTLSDLLNIIPNMVPKYMFVDEKYLETMETVVETLNLTLEIIVLGKSTKYMQFSEFQEPEPGEDAFEPIKIEDTSRTAIIYATSGTTGTPKGTCLSHNNLLWFQKPSKKDPDETVDTRILLSYGSLSTISRGNLLTTAIHYGMCVLLSNIFNPQTFWELVDKYKVFGAFLTTTEIIETGQYEKPENIKAEIFEHIFTGGNTLSQKYVKQMKEKLPKLWIWQGYMQTETATSITDFDMTNPVHQRFYFEKPSSIGLPKKCISYKVVDPESGKVLGPNDPGELLVKLKYKMNGYYKMESNCYDEEGWLKTGDIVYYDEDFCFFFVERLKEQIKYKSKTVFPGVIEKEILKHPAVKDVTVIGLPHETDGEHIMAIVIKNKGFENVTGEEIQEFSEKSLNFKEKLRAGVRFVESFPFTLTGKVKRRDLRKMVINGEIM